MIGKASERKDESWRSSSLRSAQRAFEERDAPTIIKPRCRHQDLGHLRLRVRLWPYRGISPVTQPTPMGHEYCGIVEEVGSAVTSIKPGQFAIGSVFASDSTCPHCQASYQTSCQHKEFISTAQAPMLSVPFADGTLVATPDVLSEDLIPSLLSVSDVFVPPGGRRCVAACGGTRSRLTNCGSDIPVACLDTRAKRNRPNSTNAARAVDEPSTASCSRTKFFGHPRHYSPTSTVSRVQT